MHRLDHAAQLLATFNVFEPEGGPLGHVGLITRRPVVSMAVRAIGVVVGRERLDQVVEMIATKNDEVVQNLVLDRLDDSLHFGIQIGRSHGDLLALDPSSLHRVLELRRELGVAVVDQVSRTMFTRPGLLNELLDLFRIPHFSFTRGIHMNKPRIWENEFSHGPIGLEYLLPCDPPGFPEWLAGFRRQTRDEAAGRLAHTMQEHSATAGRLLKVVASFQARSLYYLPIDGPSNHWLLLERDTLIVYVPEPQHIAPAIAAHPTLTRLLQVFGGFGIGNNPREGDSFLRPESRFQSTSEVKLIQESDPDYLWSSDPSVIGGSAFYSTSCDNQFICRTDGSVAHWNHENSHISHAFDNLDDFSDELANGLLGLYRGEFFDFP